MNWFRNLKISVKIVLITILILLVSLGGIGISSIYFSTAGISNLSDEFLKNRASDSAKILSQKIELIREEIKGAADIDSQALLSRKPLPIKFNEFDCLRTGTVEENGNVIYSDGTTDNLSNQVFFKKAIDSDTYISDPEYLKADNQIVFYGFSKINGSNNQLVCQIKYESIAKVIENIKVGNNGYCFVDNNECTTVIHKDTDLIKKKDNDFVSFKTDPGLAQLVSLEKKMVVGETGVGSYIYNGNKKYLAYAPVEGMSWSLAVTALNKEFFSTVNTIEFTVIFLTLLALILGIGFQLLLSNLFINKPIKKIVDAASKLCLGDIDVDVDSDSKDEIGTLAKSFEKIIEGTKQCAQAAESLAAGNTNVEINARSEKDVKHQLHFIISLNCGIFRLQ